eukprot:366167-Chlamydomonas_euryale.AAC.2
MGLAAATAAWAAGCSLLVTHTVHWILALCVWGGGAEARMYELAAGCCTSVRAALRSRAAALLTLCCSLRAY